MLSPIWVPNSLTPESLTRHVHVPSSLPKVGLGLPGAWRAEGQAAMGLQKSFQKPFQPSTPMKSTTRVTGSEGRWQNSSERSDSNYEVRKRANRFINVLGLLICSLSGSHFLTPQPTIPPFWVVLKSEGNGREVRNQPDRMGRAASRPLRPVSPPPTITVLIPTLREVSSRRTV